jgi:hypothetical protein
MTATDGEQWRKETKNQFFSRLFCPTLLEVDICNIRIKYKIGIE